jgi:hypothetical protein
LFWCPAKQLLFRDTEPLKVTFTRGLFFTGLKGKNKIVGMVLAYVCKTAPKRLESDSVFPAVLAFHFFRHGNFSVLLLLDTYCGMPDQLRNRWPFLGFCCQGAIPELFLRVAVWWEYCSIIRS